MVSKEIVFSGAVFDKKGAGNPAITDINAGFSDYYYLKNFENWCIIQYRRIILLKCIERRS
ncbi:MAG: hypothetical protein IKH50_07335 [Oscillospiraceae bacterium]|nr:hypothetical protein [Oscillospiraceae bacterium]